MTLRFHWYLPTNGDGRDRLGLSEFILSGYPHLEEAYWFGEGVLPILRARGLWRHPVLAAADDTRNTTSVGATPELPPRQPAAVP